MSQVNDSVRGLLADFFAARLEARENKTGTARPTSDGKNPTDLLRIREDQTRIPRHGGLSSVDASAIGPPSSLDHHRQ